MTEEQEYPDLPKSIWKPVEWEECERCGDGVECFTRAGGNHVYDEDKIRCVACGATGFMSADGERAWAVWDDDDLPEGITGGTE